MSVKTCFFYIEMITDLSKNIVKWWTNAALGIASVGLDNISLFSIFNFIIEEFVGEGCLKGAYKMLFSLSCNRLF